MQVQSKFMQMLTIETLNFYEFLKTLETYESTIDKKNTLIMTTDSDYFKYFKNIEQK